MRLALILAGSGLIISLLSTAFPKLGHVDKDPPRKCDHRAPEKRPASLSRAHLR